MSQDQSTARADTFAECRRALQDYSAHMPIVHMWENAHANKNAVDAESLKEREGEVASVLGVMSGDNKVTYRDGRYLQNIERLKKAGVDSKIAALDTHVLRGSKNGFIGIATSPLFEHSQFSRLYDHNSDTGLLLLDSTPVLVSPHDAWSLYFENKNDIPAEGAWKYRWDDMQKRHKMDQNGMTEGGARFAGVGYFTNNKEARHKLAGKVAMLVLQPNNALHRIVEMQGNPEHLSKGFVTVDPLSTQTHAQARQAYQELMHAYEHDEKAFVWPSEVVANATLEHVAGILVHNSPGGNPAKPGANATRAPVVDPKKPWSETLQENPKLAVSLYHAFKEYDQLVKRMQSPEVKKQFPKLRVPTILIYQPHAAQNLIHAEPTPALRQIVEGFLRSRGLLTQPSNAKSL